ncbi:MAG: hypothetical protein U9Q80_00485 [Bacillota bacterium]|nr:hypothetical protein [Bacillota bacterium]
MDIVKWLLEGDISIRYQVHRDLLKSESSILGNLKSRIYNEGFAKELLALQKEDGHWGDGFYQPKWTCTHYTLLELRYLELNKTDSTTKILDKIVSECINFDGGITPTKTKFGSDVCINGMFLNYACYFGIEENRIESIIDYIIEQQLPDGGFNCNFNRSGARHSSLHSTLSVLEGIEEYILNGYTYQIDKLKKMKSEAIEFILIHRLYKSDHTGEIIQKAMTYITYPPRWKYDILKALDYFNHADIPYDSRMEDSINLLKKKMDKEGIWPNQGKHKGAVHFEMEPNSKKSRFNTLRVLRVLMRYDD